MSAVYPENVRLTADGAAVRILDQTRLPGETVYLELKTPEELREAICALRVRGAPAIGIFAAYAIYVLCLYSGAADERQLRLFFARQKAELDSARPTAVNLRKMLDRMERVLDSAAGRSAAEILAALRQEAEQIQQEDIAMCRAISEHGLALVREGDGILTHCNAGALATSCYGTALGPLLLAAERGITLHAWCDETRPLLQGARLTSYELSRAGVDTTLICDNMASAVMQQGKIQACFVGCDRLAANGDAANKIGTSGVAILAAHYGVPFYVFCPTSTIDFLCPDGAHIPIELRDPAEIGRKYFEKPMAPEHVKCFNPAFDVTDHTLITGIVTEKGVLRPPYAQSLAALLEGGKK